MRFEFVAPFEYWRVTDFYQGFDGPLPAKLEDLTLDSPQLIYRKVCTPIEFPISLTQNPWPDFHESLGPTNHHR